MSRPASTPRSSTPRLSGPGELAGALPLLCGFRPRESLVVVALHGSGRRVGLTARYDLPDEEHDEVLADDVVERLLTVGVRRAYALVVTEQTGTEQTVTERTGRSLPRAPLVAALRGAVDRGGLHLVDVLLVRDGRWWSYVCSDRGCCPADGTPVPSSSPTLTLVEAQSVLQGRAVLGSREELVASLAPPALPGPALTALREAEAELAEELGRSGRTVLRDRLRQRFLDALAQGGPRDDRQAAELAHALHDALLRDEVLTWALRRESALLAVLLHLARTTPAPYDAAVCACLAWVAYGRGDGATAGIALDRALATDPQHGLARLLADALDRQVPPRQLRAVAVRTATALRRRG